MILSPYTTDASLDELKEAGQFYDVTKLWRRLYDQHSNKKEEVDFVNKIEIVVWSLKLEVYEDLYAAVFEWIEPEPKPWERVAVAQQQMLNLLAHNRPSQ